MLAAMWVVIGIILVVLEIYRRKSDYSGDTGLALFFMVYPAVVFFGLVATVVLQGWLHFGWLVAALSTLGVLSHLISRRWSVISIVTGLCFIGAVAAVVSGIVKV